LNFLDIFSKYPEIPNFRKIQWDPSCSMRAERDKRTDMTKKPKNQHWRLQVLRQFSCANALIHTASLTLLVASCGPQHLPKWPLGPLLTHNINTLTILIFRWWTLCDTWERHSSLSGPTHNLQQAPSWVATPIWLPTVPSILKRWQRKTFEKSWEKSCTFSSTLCKHQRNVSPSSTEIMRKTSTIISASPCKCNSQRNHCGATDDTVWKQILKKYTGVQVGSTLGTVSNDVVGKLNVVFV
jgi:hypothetical protein